LEKFGLAEQIGGPLGVLKLRWKSEKSLYRIKRNVVKEMLAQLGLAQLSD
jgi:hypothetical protein